MTSNNIKGLRAVLMKKVGTTDKLRLKVNCQNGDLSSYGNIAALP
jgi:hypothetical protein